MEYKASKMLIAKILMFYNRHEEFNLKLLPFD